MKTNHTPHWLHPKLVTAAAAGMVGVLLVYFFVTSLVQNRLDDYEVQTRLLIADQQATLAAIAEATARNGADTVTESVIRDCNLQERNQFDTLLGQLDKGLSHTDLVTLERLFGRCGSFYAERKALMAARLNREIEVYQSYITQLSTLLDEDARASFKVSEWQTLAAQEQKQGTLFLRLVTLQDKIISTLLAGSSPTSPDMQAILQEVGEVQGNLVVTNKQAAKTRTNLVPL